MIEGILIFFILAYTMSSIIVEQKIFEEVRSWIKQCSVDNPNWFQRKICQLISCMFCTGFWSGVFLCVIGVNLIAVPISFLAACFVHGLLGAFGSYVIHILMEFLTKKAESVGIDV